MADATKIRITRGHRRAIAAVFALLWVSGALWLVYHYFFQADGPFGPEPEALEAWWLRLHGLMAFAALLAVGSLLPLHLRGALTLRRNLASGLTTLAMLGWLALTGYALYYFADPDARPWLPCLHWSVGLVIPALLAAHVRRWRPWLPRRTAALQSSVQPELAVATPRPRHSSITHGRKRARRPHLPR